MTSLKNTRVHPLPAPGVWLAVATAVVLAACAPANVRTAPVDALAMQQAREQALAAETDWSFTGRVAMSADGRGGSGRIEWRQRGADMDIRLTAPITGQSWRLRSERGAVMLEGLDGGSRQGSDAEALLLEATGWRIPLGALGAWVRGMRASGPAALDFDSQGRPSLISQSGWEVEFRQWNAATPSLPVKLFARQGSASVRLAIDQWAQP